MIIRGRAVEGFKRCGHMGQGTECIAYVRTLALERLVRPVLHGFSVRLRRASLSHGGIEMLRVKSQYNRKRISEMLFIQTSDQTAYYPADILVSLCS